MLKRLGNRFAAAVSPNRSYRLGGDEFCFVAPVGAGAAVAIVEGAAAALTEEGEGFSVHNSYGWALTPSETDSVSEALKLADDRMYASKGRRAIPGQTLNKSGPLDEVEWEMLSKHTLIGFVCDAFNAMLSGRPLRPPIQGRANSSGGDRGAASARRDAVRSAPRRAVLRNAYARRSGRTTSRGRR